LFLIISLLITVNPYPQLVVLIIYSSASTGINDGIKDDAEQNNSTLPVELISFVNSVICNNVDL
jgi:hypothetical protein